MRFKFPRFIVLSAWASLALFSCTDTGTRPAPTILSGQPTITPYPLQPTRPSSTPSPIITSTQAPLLPSSTPLVHTIEAGDTLIALALRYSVTLDDLLAANPGINSTQLTIGQELIIPGENGAGQAFPTPTPLPAELSSPGCFRTGTGGLVCFLTASNPLTQGIENLSVLANLHVTDGELLWSDIIIPPLDILPPESSLPLSLRVPAPVPEGAQLFVTLLTSLPSKSSSPPLETTSDQVIYDQNRQSAQISGVVRIPEGDFPAGEVWLVAAAYDSSNQPIGLRKWISSTAAAPGDQLAFSVTVYSPGPPIDRVRLFAELH